MSYYLRALSTEFFKLRRTLAFWCILIAPSLLVILAYSVLLRNEPSAYGPEYKAWQSTITNALTMWSLLVLPLYIALQTTLLAQLEHTNQQWKHLYALPVPRLAYFAAKWMVVTLVMVATHLLLGAELVGAGKLIELVKPGYGLTAPIPWGDLTFGVSVISGAALLLLTFHLLVSLWWRSVVPSLGIGVMAALLNVFSASSDKYSVYNPWLFPGLAYRGEGPEATTLLWVGLGGGLLLAVLGGMLFVRKQVN